MSSSRRPQRTVQARHMLTAVTLFAALSACSRLPDKSPDAQRGATPAAAGRTDPLASFALLIPGVWRQTAASGQSMYHTWHWGPGRGSIRRMTVGAGANGKPWYELQVFYRHPKRRQVCVLGLSPFARGVSEGTIRFEGDHADGVADLYQLGVHRRMGLRWAFDGPDLYHDTLLEATGQDGFEPLVVFDNVRMTSAAAPRPAFVEGAKPSGYLEAFKPFLGHTWEGNGELSDGGAIQTRTTLEWIPIVDAIYVRVTVPTTEGEPAHLLDAYIYHHTGAGVLRCLAHSNTGGVYEGDVSVAEDGAVQMDLNGYEGERSGRYIVRLGFESDGTVRSRIRSADGNARALILDLLHRKQGTKSE